MLSVVLAVICSLGASGGSNECPPNWQPPEIHGIRLGMTVRQVKSRLHFLKIPRADKYDVRETFLYVTTNREQRKRLPKVFQIEMWFWKNRLVRYNVQYYGSEKPEAVSQFVSRVVNGFKLPEEAKVSRNYECGNVSVSIGKEGRRAVSLRDLHGEAVLVKRVDESYGIK